MGIASSIYLTRIMTDPSVKGNLSSVWVVNCALALLIKKLNVIHCSFPLSFHPPPFSLSPFPSFPSLPPLSFHTLPFPFPLPSPTAFSSLPPSFLQSFVFFIRSPPYFLSLLPVSSTVGR